MPRETGHFLSDVEEPLGGAGKLTDLRFGYARKDFSSDHSTRDQRSGRA